MEIKKDKMETGWKSCENVRLVKVDDDVMRQLHVETEPRVESAPGKPTANGTWSTHYGTGIIVARTCISGGVDIKEESSGTPQPQVHSRIFGVIFTWLDFTLNSCSHHLRAFSRNNPLICPITGLSEFANAKSSFSGCQSAQLMLLCLIAFLPWADTKMNFPSYSFLFILTFSSFLCRYYWKSERIEENGWLKSEEWIVIIIIRRSAQYSIRSLASLNKLLVGHASVVLPGFEGSDWTRSSCSQDILWMVTRLSSNSTMANRSGKDNSFVFDHGPLFPLFHLFPR